MNKLLFAIFCVTSSVGMANALPTQASERHAYKEIHTEELKSWYAQDKEMVLLDARNDSFNGMLLPKGIWMPYNAPDEAIEKAVPSKDALIVVYCANSTCPVSNTLVDRLLALGYTNVYKYPEGIQEWVSLGLPTIQTSRP